MRDGAQSLSGLSILCVDDYPDSLVLLNAVLSRCGAAVTQCLSAELAIAMLKDKSFDVIVSDLSMPPGMDGYDLAHALRKMEQDGRRPTPAIALSGKALESSPKKRFADFQAYLVKPFDRVRLVDVVKRLAEANGAVVKAGSLEIYEANHRTQAAATAMKP